jgi:hypothetical protein
MAPSEGKKAERQVAVSYNRLMTASTGGLQKGRPDEPALKFSVKNDVF